MKTVITYGTFDLLHIGHISMLKRAKSYCDRLIVGLSTDEFNLFKKKHSVTCYNHRKILLESIQYVDLVIPENSWEQKTNDIINFKVDYFIIGNDWKNQFDHLNHLCQVIYLDRTEGVSSSLIKETICKLNYE